MRVLTTASAERASRVRQLLVTVALMIGVYTGAGFAASNPGKIVYAEPYYYGAWTSTSPCQDHSSLSKPSGPGEATIDSAVADFKLSSLHCLGGGCTYTVTPIDPQNNYPNIASFVTLGGSCNGGEDIYATPMSRDIGAGGAHGSGEGDPSGDSGTGVGDPINSASGNKFVEETDYSATPWLTFRRMYNSNLSFGTPSTLGPQWSHSFNRTLLIVGSPGSLVIANRPDGSQEKFTKSGSTWTSADSPTNTLTELDDAQGNPTSYGLFIASSRRTEIYSPSGQLLSMSDQTGQGVTLTYSTSTTSTSIAPASGLLLTVTDSKNRQLSFGYNSDGTLHQLIQPDGGAITYSYNSGALYSVQYPDAKARTYAYNESSLSNGASRKLLTGIIDEAGFRYSSTAYDRSQRATGTDFGGSASGVDDGVNLTAVTYNADATSTVTYPLGHSAVISFSQYNNVSLIGSFDQACGTDCAQSWQSRTYDTNGYPASTLDFKGTKTVTSYDSYGDLTSEVDASGTPSQRTTSTTWNSVLHVPLGRTIFDKDGHPVSKAAWVYNSMAEPTARCEVDPIAAPSYVCTTNGTTPAGVQRWVYTYCTAIAAGCPLKGLLLKATGPRADLSQTETHTYYTASSATGCGTPGASCYQIGDLHTVTDALGHVTTIVSYDANGQVTRVTDPNGVNTDFTYTPRGQIATQSIGRAATTFSYEAYDAVHSIKDPDGITTTYNHDLAHRLISIVDGSGNSINFTLDDAGNATSQQVETASGSLARSVSRTYNSLGQLTTIVDGLNNTIFRADAASSYDSNGDLVLSSDANGIQRQRGLDPLRRLVSTIQNYGGTDIATKNTATTIAYDSLNHIVGVSDPGALNTIYTFDGLGNRTALQSPDTGSSSDTFDAGGNRLTHKDAKGTVATSTYDALDRLLTTSYVDASLNVSYKYDEANTVTGCAASVPIGRLTRMIESSVTTTYCYDERGNTIQKRQLLGATTDITTYSYTAANRLANEVTPGLTSLTYTRDVLGNITSILITPNVGASATAVSAVTYLPFGPVNSYKLGNGQVVTRTYNSNYAVTDVVSPALALHFARDAMGNIAAIGNSAGVSVATETFGYDPLYRLVSVKDGTTTVEGFTYNPTGDRLTKTGIGISTGAYSYSAGSHQISSIGNATRANDANGNTSAATSGGQMYGFGYNGRNRLSVVQASGQTVGTYTYNAINQRVLKVATLPQAVTQRYAYNENNQLIGEYSSSGRRDTVWMDATPVAIVDIGATASNVSFIHADGLETPRAVSNSAGVTIWSWAYKGNPFGEVAPATSGSFVFNLRLPGQYFDSESGLAYNLHRTFEPATGRYLESDPTGLRGGISTYLYALGTPLQLSDLLGLNPSSDRHISYYPYGIWTTPAEIEAYPAGPAATNGGIPSVVPDVAGVGLSMGLGAELGIGMGSFGSAIAGGIFAESITHMDYGNEPYIQHTMPRL